MNPKAVKILQYLLPPAFMSFLKAVKQNSNTVHPDNSAGFSNLNEEAIINKYLPAFLTNRNYCVDIAASDGISMSNTLFLFKKGWDGIAVECDANKFAKLSDLYVVFPNVNLVKTRVVPDNVVSILKSCLCPSDFSFLNFDIDSYDFFVLDQLLSEFRPHLICVEINEKIPPPISFAVKFDQDHVWNADHFYGQSISKCYELCEKYRYEIVELYYNNLFIVPREENKYGALSPEAAFETGYKNKIDRKDKFPWNADMEAILTMSKNDAVIFLNSKFEKYAGKYELK
jgi:hypothetical protein